MRKVVVIVLLLLAVFTFINAYSTEQGSLAATASVPVAQAAD
jgi:uncharacterized integral membrane protein